MSSWRAPNDRREEPSARVRTRNIQVIGPDRTPPGFEQPVPRSEALHEELSSIYDQPQDPPALPAAAELTSDSLRFAPSDTDPYAAPASSSTTAPDETDTDRLDSARDETPAFDGNHLNAFSSEMRGSSDVHSTRGPSFEVTPSDMTSERSSSSPSDIERPAAVPFAVSSASEELDRAERVATAVMNIAELRTALRNMPSEALARELLRAADSELLTVTRLLTSRLHDSQAGERQLSRDAETALSVVEWLVSTLVPGSTIDEIAPELRAIREPNPAA
jgi:hypothetical protein